MANVLNMFPFNEIKTNQDVSVNGKVEATGTTFFPKMYFCNKSLESGPYKGEFAYLVSKYGGKEYHLPPTFYYKGKEAMDGTGVYFAAYKNFPNGKIPDKWAKANIYDFHFLLRLYLISGEDYGNLIKRNCYYSLGKIPNQYLKYGEKASTYESPIILPDMERNGTYIPNAKFYYRRTAPNGTKVVKNYRYTAKIYNSTTHQYDYKNFYEYYAANQTKDVWPCAFETKRKENEYDFGDLFLPVEYTDNANLAITHPLQNLETKLKDGKLCLHVNLPKDDDSDLFRCAEHDNVDIYPQEKSLYVKVIYQ